MSDLTLRQVRGVPDRPHGGGSLDTREAYVIGVPGEASEAM
jgi:hypothetical protein